MNIMITCIYSTLIYPYYTANEFPNGWRLYLLLTCEFIYLIDMVIHFFLQDLDVDKISRRDPLTTVATNYYYGQFKWDLIAFIPFGLFGFLNQKMEILWVIKAIRIKSLNYYLKNSKLLQIVKDYYEMFQKRNFQNEEKREDMTIDHIRISDKIYMMNFMKIFRLVFQILFVAYFIS